jgi:tRNA pseudouridine55 synthase
MQGVLNIYKPSGPTSHDVVARVRRVLGVRRVGHAGTLDPMARGVLVVCIGSATRIVEYFGDLPKRYLAEMTLGVATETQDTTGRVLQERPAEHVREEALRAVLERFRGPILQVPPMVSAVKHEGRRLYELARAGHEVERAARPVTIYELELRAFQPGERPTAVLAVTCSGGTYVRTLCAEIGDALGTGAALSDLERTAVGPFRAAESRTLSELEQLAAEGRASEALLSPAAALAHLPTVVVDEAGCVAIAHGRSVPVLDGPADRLPHHFPRLRGDKQTGGHYRVLAPDGELIAIGRVDERDGSRVVAPEKVFRPAA